MDVKKFTSIFPVPDQPEEPADPKAWSKYEKQLSTELPDDYKWYIETYGTGCISMFLWIFNPFSKNKNLNLINQVESYRKQFKKVGLEVTKYPFFPEKDGLLPFGVSDNGDVFYWLTGGNPNEWRVAVNPSRHVDYEISDSTMTEYLVNIVEGDIKSEVFSDEMIDRDSLFLPASQVEY